MSNKITRSDTIIAGRLIASDVRRFLCRQKMIQQQKLNIDWNESKSLFEIDFNISITGNPTLVDKWWFSTRDYFYELQMDW